MKKRHNNITTFHLTVEESGVKITQFSGCFVNKYTSPDGEISYSLSHFFDDPIPGEVVKRGIFDVKQISPEHASYLTYAHFGFSEKTEPPYELTSNDGTIVIPESTKRTLFWDFDRPECSTKYAVVIISHIDPEIKVSDDFFVIRKLEVEKYDKYAHPYNDRHEIVMLVSYEKDGILAYDEKTKTIVLI